MSAPAVEPERIETCLLALVRARPEHKIAAHILVDEVAEDLGVDRSRVGRAVMGLVGAGSLVYLCRGDPFNELEVSLHS